MLRMAVRGVGTVTLLLLLALVFTPLPRLLSRWLSASAPLAPADAIVVLGGGGVRGDGELSDTSLRRAWEGIRLYQRGLAPLLVFAGAASTPGGPSEAAARAQLARACAVAPGAILAEASARTTREEADVLARRLRPRAVRTILLVADVEGMGRALRLFRRAGFEVIPAAVADVDAMGRPEDQLAVTRRVAIELVARVYYALAGYF